MNYRFTCIFSVLLIIIAEVTPSHRFGYTRPEQRRWARKHRTCAGRHQSPISISYYKAVSVPMPAIELIGYHNLLPGPIHIHNNGHSVTLSVPKLGPIQIDKGEKLPFIFGGKLKNDYELEGLHFHWGDKNNRGSEHVLNDVRYPMEMHIIHRNTKYADVSESLQHPDGLCVLGFFYQISETDSPHIASFIQNLNSITDYNKSLFLNWTLSLSSLLGEVDTDRFYTYKGSLTTPPCSEAVTWMIFPDTLKISVQQLSRFRMLSNGIEGSILVDNYRALQPIGNRRIFVRDINEKKTSLISIKNGIHYSHWDWLY